MKILHINKFAYPKGGAEVYALGVAERQARQGHEVHFYGSVRHTTPTGSRVLFHDVAVDDYHSADRRGRAAAARDVLWSKRVHDDLLGVIDDFRPDIAHLHNYAHQLSSSVISALQRRHVPSIYTAHDYKLICPAYVASVDGHDCFACVHKVSRKLLEQRCHHDRLSWSGLVGIEAMATRSRRWLPDRIIAPSEFMRARLVDSWLGDLRVVDHIRNPAEPAGHDWTGGGGYLLYVGRLSREKGLTELVEACSDAGARLVLAGDGPMRAQLEAQAIALGAEVEFLGQIDQKSLSEVRSACTAQVIPSTWPENAPLAALEAIVEGVPIIAAARGGLPELLASGANVALMDTVSASSLRGSLERLEGWQGSLGAQRELYSWSRHLDRLAESYEAAMRTSVAQGSAGR